MDGIIANLQDPAWWFTGVFFILIALLISGAMKKLPTFFKKLNRSSKAKSLRKIKSIRHSKYEVFYQITLDSSYFQIFILSCFFYLALLVASPLASIFKQSTLAGILLTLPLYVVEVIWLWKNAFVKDLIKAAKKIA